MTSVDTKFEPLTVSVKEGFPATVFEGTREEITGPPTWGATMVNDDGADVPPPGAGFSTVTWAVPAVATSDARMSTFNCCVLGL